MSRWISSSRKVENGKRKMESGKRKMESGTRKMENGTQKTENGMKTFHEQFLFGGQFKKLNVNKIKT